MKLACIDIGGTTVKSLFVEAQKGAPLSSYKWEGYGFAPTCAAQGFEAIKRSVLLSIESVLARCSCDAIAVATAGTVDWDSGKVVFATEALPGFSGFDLRGFLKAEFDMPVRVINDATAAAVAEHYNGDHIGSDEAVLTIGTGLGAAVVAADRLDATGVTDIKLGHVTYVPGGHRCKCGKLGCLEQYVSATAMRRDCANSDLDAVFADKATYGAQIDAFEEALCFAVRKASEYAPYIVIGGGVTEIARWWDDFTKKLGPVFADRIKKASLGNRAGALGAAYAALNGSFERQ